MTDLDPLAEKLKPYVLWPAEDAAGIAHEHYAELRAEVARLAAELADYRAACESQGLPPDTPIDRFVQHHRGNAAMTAGGNALAEVRRRMAETGETP